MATKVKGITIELNADATGIEKALKDVNKSLATTQKDLKDVNKALALDPSNMDLVKQKTRLLGEAIDGTKAKLKALKDAQANLKMDGSEEAQRQFDALTREISGTEKALDKLNKEMVDFGLQASRSWAESTKFGTALTTIKEKAEAVADATAQMSAAAAAALAGMVGLVTGAASFADDMLTTAQQTGLSTEALQKMAYAADRVDVPLETIVASVKKMKSGLDKNEGAYQRLGVHIKDQKGDYRDIESIFMETITALGRIENETQRDTMAMQLFGESADKLAGLIDDGGKKLRQLGQEADNMGLIVSDEQLQKLGEFSDKLDAMKQQLKFAGVQAAIPILEALTPVINAVSNAITKIASVLSNMNPKLLQIITVVLLIIAAISPMAKIISGICSGLITLIQIGGLLVSGIKMIASAAMAALANPYVLIIGAIIVAVVALAAAIAYCAANWDEIKPKIDGAMDSMKSGVKSAFNKVEKTAQSSLESVKDRFGSLEMAIIKFTGSATSLFMPLSGSIFQLGTAFYELKDKIAQALNNIKNWFNRLIQDARNAGANTMKAFSQGLTSFINTVVNAVKSMVDSIKSIWKTAERDASDAGKNTAKAYVDSYNSNSKDIKPVKFSSTPGSRPTTSAPNGSAPGITQLTAAVNTLNSNIIQMQRRPSGAQVNVELVGSAKNIFDTVRVQNNVLKTATGYHALA